MNSTLSERDQRVIWHPFTPQKYSPLPIPIVKGDGVHLIDTSGKKYIDAISSWWVTLHGHGHPYIAEKIYAQARQLEQVIFAGFTHEPAVELAERLLALLGSPFSRVFYSDNGSTSTEVAIKMAIQYWWNRDDSSRTRILALRNSYHGDTFGSMSLSERSVFTVPFHDRLFEVQFIDPPTKESLPSLLAQLETDQFAAFIYEPLVQGAGGMVMYESPALDDLLRVLKKNGVICIADEVMTGFGRTGKTFATDYCNEKPDIICLSKGLTGGTLPLGVTACSDKIYQAFVLEDRRKTFFHGHSFTANPIACAAALASLDLLSDPNCQRQIGMIMDCHTEFLGELMHSSLAQRLRGLRQCGTIAAFEWMEESNTYLNPVSSVISSYALEKGVYLRPLGNTIYVMPPYCISKQELQTTYHVVMDALGTL